MSSNDAHHCHSHDYSHGHGHHHHHLGHDYSHGHGPHHYHLGHDYSHGHGPHHHHHGHDYSHGHGPHHHHHGLEHHEHDFVACNKEYYDKNVDKYDNPHWVAANKKQALAIRDAFNFDKEMTTVLDFACGAGTLARELAPYAKSIIGVDISPVAIDEFNAKAAEAGHGPDVLRGICTELKGEEGELDGAKFDLVTCCAAYHHFSDYNKVTTILAKFLKPGGMLCVLDRLAGTDHEVAAHGAHHEKGPAEEVDLERVVPHRHGIVSDDLLPGFQEAGLKDYTFEPSFDAEWMGMGFKIFLAKGIKPAE